MVVGGGQVEEIANLVNLIIYVVHHSPKSCKTIKIFFGRKKKKPHYYQIYYYQNEFAFLINVQISSTLLLIAIDHHCSHPKIESPLCLLRVNPELCTTFSPVMSSSSPVFIPTESLCNILTHKTLMNHFQSNLPKVSTFLQTPIRQHYDVSLSSSLLLMPSWSSSPSFPYMGVKLVTHFPQNSAIDLPGVQGSYVLFSSATGQTLASMDSTELTLYRTSSVSGLASKYLARDDSEVLVMVGAGALAPHLIRAHLSATPSLRKVIIWNRTLEKAITLAQKLRKSDEFPGVSFEGCGCLDDVVGIGDIVSCATNSEAPLVKGEWLKDGAHLDLVGSFKHSMKECDDEAIRRGKVFVDNEAALVEAGELVGAFDRGVIKKDEIGGTLVELVSGEKVGRSNSKQITVFKSVGSAVVDMLAAQFVYEAYTQGAR